MQMWMPAVISGFLSLLSAAVVVGSVRQITKEHERRLNDFDDDQKDQWSHISRTETRLSNLRGQLGLNGGE